MMLAPVVITLGVAATRRAHRAGHTDASTSAPIPWFVLGFVALVGVNSVVHISADVKAMIAMLTTFLLSVALAAMGLETDIAKLRAKGLRPLVLGLAAFLFISGFSLVLIKLTT